MWDRRARVPRKAPENGAVEVWPAAIAGWNRNGNIGGVRAAGREGIQGLFDRTRYRADHNPHIPAEHSGRLLPPLEPLSDESPYQTRANWRWMLATFLTGIAGIGLIGGALFNSFDGRATLASSVHLVRKGGEALGLGGGIARKGNRMLPEDARIALRQMVFESNVTKVGAKEFINVKPYVHVVSSLALSTGNATADLPAFNPLKLFSASADESAKEPSQARIASSGEIRVTSLAFNPATIFATADDIGLHESEMAVLELAQMKGLTGGQLAESGDDTIIDPTGDSLLADGAVELASLDPNANLITLEGGPNAVTEIEKNPGRSYFSNRADKVLAVQRGDTLSALLQSHGASPQEARAIARAMAPEFRAVDLAEGQQVRLSFSNGQDKGKLKPTRISLYDGESHLVTVGLSDGGDEAEYALLPSNDALSVPDAGLHVSRYQARAQLYQSLYETGYSMGLNDGLMSRIVRIHSYDVDFKRQVQAGDNFEVFYEADDKEGNVSGDPNVLYTALTIRGETKKFYRFRTSDDGVVDFYDENGNSAKKFLIRKPMNGGVLRSGFGVRTHPILRYRKMHTGVDWAAPSGTPIVAAGNGIVEQAKYTSGYGRYTIIRHANGYATGYAHQSAFAKGIEPGARVRQGQVIGYVGSTGLSTGPHLHYEVIVNGRMVDPMRIRVPRGRTLQGRMLASFQREKTRIERLMRQPAAAPRIASAAASYALSSAR